MKTVETPLTSQPAGSSDMEGLKGLRINIPVAVVDGKKLVGLKTTVVAVGDTLNLKDMSRNNYDDVVTLALFHNPQTGEMTVITGRYEK